MKPPGNLGDFTPIYQCNELGSAEEISKPRTRITCTNEHLPDSNWNPSLRNEKLVVQLHTLEPAAAHYRVCTLVFPPGTPPRFVHRLDR
jgi:hypothetical protein